MSLNCTKCGGRVIYQRKKTGSQCNKTHGFCFGTAIVFFVAASKTDVTSKTEYLGIGFNPKQHLFCNLGL